LRFREIQVNTGKTSIVDVVSNLLKAYGIMNISNCYKRCPCIFSAVFFIGSFGIDIGKADVKTTVRRTNTSK